MTENTHPAVQLKRAQNVLAIAEANRVMAEAVRGHRAGGPQAALELVFSSGIHVRDFTAAAVMAARTWSEALCAAEDNDVDAFLAGWLEQALSDEKAAEAVLRELTGQETPEADLREIPDRHRLGNRTDETEGGGDQ